MSTAMLTVFRDIQHCDTAHEHPVTLITDGRSAFCFTDGDKVRDAVARDREKVTACCPHDWCLGQVTFDLTEAGTWTADPTVLSLFARYGDLTVIES